MHETDHETKNVTISDRVYSLTTYKVPTRSKYSECQYGYETRSSTGQIIRKASGWWTREHAEQDAQTGIRLHDSGRSGK